MERYECLLNSYLCENAKSLDSIEPTCSENSNSETISGAKKISWTFGASLCKAEFLRTPYTHVYGDF